MRWYQDPANRNEAIALIANFLKRPPAALEQWIFNKNDFFRDRDTMVDLKSLQNNIDVMSKIGVVIKEGFDVSKYADLSVVGEAALTQIASHQLIHRPNAGVTSCVVWVGGQSWPARRGAWDKPRS